MNYADFEAVITPARMGRYLATCGGNTRKTMTLYRKNIKLSQELFTVISCFEIALRNAIDGHYTKVLGNDWLENAAAPTGIFDNNKCRLTQNNINDAIRNLNQHYSHYKLIAELGFGFWRYYYLILQLFQWMEIDAHALLFGLDHIEEVCDNIDNL